VDDLISICDRRRVRVTYTAHLPAVAFLFHHCIPYFVKRNRDIHFLVYSESIARKLKVEYQAFFEDMSDFKREIKDALDEAEIIKVGTNDKVPFGKLHYLVHIKDPKDTIDNLIPVLKKLDENDVLIIYGLYLIPVIYGFEGIWEILRLFESLKEDLTLVSFVPLEAYPTTSIHGLFREIYDIVINICREKDYVAFGEEIYLLGLEQSYTPKMPPGYIRVRVSPELKLVMV